MIKINSSSSVPINDQIKMGVKGLVAKRLLRPGDQVPSVRSLAERLKVNPNTVVRAFRELALEGFIESRRGDGNYISDTAIRKLENGLSDVRQKLQDALQMARQGGLSWQNILDLVKEIKEEER